MSTSMERVFYTDQINKEQAMAFLNRIEEAGATDFNSVVFYTRFLDALEEACEESEFTGAFEWRSDYQFALKEDEIIGYIFLNANEEELVREESPTKWPHACIWDLYVLPPYRGQGIAKQLIKRGLESQSESIESFYNLHQEEGVPLCIGAEALNESADRFFQSLSFELFPFEGNEYVWGIEALKLKERLN